MDPSRKVQSAVQHYQNNHISLNFLRPQKQMQNTTQKACNMLNDKMLDEIKVAAEMGVAATKPDIRAYPGLYITDIDGGDLEQRIQQSLNLPYGMPIFDEDCAWGRVIPVETLEKLKDELYINLESGGMLNSQVDEVYEAASTSCWWKKFVPCVGCANVYVENIAKPEIGLLFAGATMQNIYQLITSGVVISGRGKTLMKMNEAAFVMLLYGLVMPRRAAGHFALASGVALASAAYLLTMSFGF
ncbi:uncharacterized protein LOC141644052 [Silene latifolia]|uniref:uncharacterized protein LOC141644052 n=1 Tax=Silene latifolia TaxID=37657 RepID=UPI003D76B5A5